MKKIVTLFLLTIFKAYPTDSFKIVPLNELIARQPSLHYQKCHNRMRLWLTPFPIASATNLDYPDPVLPETFVISIPNGQICNQNIGYFTMSNGEIIKELIWPWNPLRKQQSVNLNILPNCQKITGRVVTIHQEGSKNYYHWLTEVLPKIALLEMLDIQYDWIYVQADLPFMKESLKRIGIEEHKIIQPQINDYLEADELIIPSFASISCCTPQWIANYLRAKLMPSSSKFQATKKVFISRSKASYRRIINEDEIFELLKATGFLRYNLEDLSFGEQIELFQNAKIIIAPHGAGLANLIFSSPGTKVFELFQEHEDHTFWYLSQTLKLEHHCLKTTEFKPNSGFNNTYVPPQIIKDILPLIN